jgi:hypothetical protein
MGLGLLPPGSPAGGSFVERVEEWRAALKMGPIGSGVPASVCAGPQLEAVRYEAGMPPLGSDGVAVTCAAQFPAIRDRLT